MSATTADVLPLGTETFYLVSAPISSTIGHAFKVGFAAGGVSTSIGGIGTAVTASDADRVTIVLGVPFGIISAVYRNSPTDYGVRLGAILGLAIPNFWLATLVILIPIQMWGYAAYG